MRKLAFILPVYKLETVVKPIHPSHNDRAVSLEKLSIYHVANNIQLQYFNIRNYNTFGIVKMVFKNKLSFNSNI